MTRGGVGFGVFPAAKNRDKERKTAVFVYISGVSRLSACRQRRGYYVGRPTLLGLCCFIRVFWRR